MVRHAWKLDNKLTAMMVDDMLFDPILASKVLLRVKIPPHEELRILNMWTTYYTVDDSGFSTGKSWTFALISALRSILMPNRTSGIISKTFSQGKLIFANFDNWYGASPIFRSCIKHIKGNPRLVHGQDAWVAYFRGQSEIRVLPPNFVQDSERIRSERWNDGYFDEWTTYGNFKAFNTTFIGRVSKVTMHDSCPVRQNHIHLGSTPAFKNHPAYTILKAVNRNIAVGSKDYSRFSCNYRHIPDTEEWGWLVSKKTIFHMQTVNPEGIVRSEVDGLWSNNSGSYYNENFVNSVKSSTETAMFCRANPDDVFIGGFDVARGNQNRTGTRKSGDDFSLSVFMIKDGVSRPVHVLTYRKNNITDEQMSAIVHMYHRFFGFSFIVFDPGGGGLFVRDHLRKDQQIINNEPTVCTPLLTADDTSGALGENILISFSRGDPYIAQLWGKMSSESVLTNRMHKEVKSAIESGGIVLAKNWDGWDDEGTALDPGTKRDWLNNNETLNHIEKAKAEMDLAVAQLLMVDCLKDQNGNIIMDKFGMYKFKSKEKKDSAYGLCYGFIGTLIYREFVQGDMQFMTGGRSSTVFEDSEI